MLAGLAYIDSYRQQRKRAHAYYMQALLASSCSCSLGCCTPCAGQAASVHLLLLLLLKTTNLKLAERSFLLCCMLFGS